MAQANKRIEDQNSLQAGPSFEDQLRERLGREERKRRRLERHRAVALRDGEDRPPLSPADLKVLADADRLEARAVKGQRRAPSIRAAAARQRDAVGKALIERGEARRAELRLAQTIDLDAAREGVDPNAVLEARRGQVMRRLRTRDGLVMLHESGAISAQLLAVGLRYRTWYEISQASMRSCLEISDQEHRANTLWTQYRAASRRAALANRVRTMEAAVSTRLHPDALTALRAIAGEARTVNSITKAARRRERLAQGLGLALAIVADNLPETR